MTEPIKKTLLNPTKCLHDTDCVCGALKRVEAKEQVEGLIDWETKFSKAAKFPKQIHLYNYINNLLTQQAELTRLAMIDECINLAAKDYDLANDLVADLEALKNKSV